MSHFAFITKNHLNPAYGGALLGARLVAARHGLEVRHAAPQEPDSVEEQRALVARSIAERPAAMVLLPAHATGLNDAIAQVNAAGIPLFLVVSEPTAGRWVSYISTDSERMAHDVAMALLAQLPADARVAIIDGHPGSITTPERHRGFASALQRFPGMTLVDSVPGDYQFAPGRVAALQLLQRHARLDGLLAANDLMAMGALQAFAETGRRVPMVSINGTPDAVAAVRREQLHATASFNTYRFGCLAAEAVARHLRGEAVPPRIVLPADIIDAGNAAEWDIPYERRVPPDWAATLAAIPS